MTLSRRAMLQAGAALGVTAAGSACAGLPLVGEGATLKALAEAKGLYFGNAVGAGRPFADPAYRALTARECDVLVCENEMKWYVLRAQSEDFIWEPADRLVAFAAEHDMKVRGHTLLWHHPRWFPRWTDSHDYGARPAAEVERLVTTHINETCRRYPQVFSWDVINEAVDADTGALRDTVFSRNMGRPEAVMDLAFHTARAAAPNARLCYNDYMSWEAGHEAHRAGVLRLLEGFKRRGVPVDALGVQSHIGSGNTDDSVGFDTAQEREWRRFIDEAVGMGLKIEISEFDVHDKNLPLDIPTRDAAVAELGGRYLDMMLSYPQMTGIVCWGLSDKYSWLQENWPRADGQPKRTCPYDEAMQPKPLREAIARSLRAAPAR